MKKSKMFKSAVTVLLLGMFLVGALASQVSCVEYGEYAEMMAVGPKYILAAEPGEIPPPQAKRPYVIGIAYPHIKDPFWIGEAYGAFSAAEDCGVTVRFVAAAGYQDLVTQMNQVQDLIASGVDGIILAACDYTGLDPVQTEAWEKGIPVVNRVRTTHPLSPRYLIQDEVVGIVQADWIGEQLNGKGNVLMLCGQIGAAWSKKRSQGFLDRIKEKYPGLNVLAERYFEMDRPRIVDLVEDALVTFPKIDYIFCTADLQALAAVDAMRAAGIKPGEIPISTLTLSRECLQAVKQGYIKYVIPEGPAYIGRMEMYLIVKLLNGEAIPKESHKPLHGYTPEELDEYDTNRLEWAPEGWTPPRWGS